MPSKGLYSAAGTCFSAAACTTTWTPSHARLRRSTSRTSPMKNRTRSSATTCCISYCFSSSRLKTMTFLGWWHSSTRRTNAWPKDPVPPVMSTVLAVSGMALSSLVRVRPAWRDVPAQRRQRRAEVGAPVLDRKLESAPRRRLVQHAKSWTPRRRRAILRANRADRHFSRQHPGAERLLLDRHREIVPACDTSVGPVHAPLAGRAEPRGPQRRPPASAPRSVCRPGRPPQRAPRRSRMSRSIVRTKFRP